MKWLAKFFALICVAAIPVTAQSAGEGQGGEQETQIRGYWIDPSNGLMWAGKDNGKDVRWKGAVRYCRDLRLAGYSDWRLATLAELGAIYDRNANAPGLSGSGKDNLFTYHVKGNLFLTGHQWEYNPSVGSWHEFLEFNDGRSNREWERGTSSFMRALCVRGPGK